MTGSNTLTLTVDTPAARLDQFLVKQIDSLSRTQLKKLIQKGQVKVDNQVVPPSTPLEPQQVVTVQLPPQNDGILKPEAMPLEIVYDDAALIVINKPAGMVVHPGYGHPTGTLVHALLHHYPDLTHFGQHDPALATRPGIVHRLDQDTSGLILIARTVEALTRLQQQFKQRTVRKTYLALVHGQPPAPEGVIDIPLGRHLTHRQRMTTRADGKPARTSYRTGQTFADYSLLEVDLETGRTHQIRVHLAWLKCPVVGDTVYGRRKNNLGLTRQFLHAWQLSFEHPHDGQPLQLEATLNPDLQQVLDNLNYPIDDRN